MTTATARRPRFANVDVSTADLLSLIAEDQSPIEVVADEWDYYVTALRTVAAGRAGLIFPNDLRARVRGHVKPNRIGAFQRRALLEGIVEYTGDWQISNDLASRNRGRPMRVARWSGTT